MRRAIRVIVNLLGVTLLYFGMVVVLSIGVLLAKAIITL